MNTEKKLQNLPLGERVLRYRARHGLTQKQFADIVGLHRQSIVSLENNPDKPVMKTNKIRIEEALNSRN